MRWFRTLLVVISATALSFVTATGPVGASASARPAVSLEDSMAGGPAVLGLHRSSPDWKVAKNPDWAGYAMIDQSGGYFTAVKAEWTVPAVTSAGGNPSYSAYWVGIDGTSTDSNDLIQAGTESRWENGKAVYFAWTEGLPGKPQDATINIDPGNKVAVIVQSIAPNRWAVRITDETTHDRYEVQESYATYLQSAECMQERPDLKGKTGALAPTVNVTFSSCDFSLTPPSPKPPIWDPLMAPILVTTYPMTLYRYEMVNKGKIIAIPSVPNAAKDGFTVADGSKAPPLPK
jgi:Peptidase A4 family